MRHFQKALGAALHALTPRRILILVSPPQRTPPEGAPTHGPDMNFFNLDFDQVANSIDFLNVMTYDYYGEVRRPAPNSPMAWIEASVRHVLGKHMDNKEMRQKVLIGLNWYGYKFSSAKGAEAILGRDFVQLLQDKPQPFHWDREIQEHMIQFPGKKDDLSVVFYPTLHSIDARLQLAIRLDVGVAIWELGQGLDYFYDLL